MYTTSARARTPAYHVKDCFPRSFVRSSTCRQQHSPHGLTLLSSIPDVRRLAPPPHRAHGARGALPGRTHCLVRRRHSTHSVQPSITSGEDQEKLETLQAPYQSEDAASSLRDLQVASWSKPSPPHNQRSPCSLAGSASTQFLLIVMFLLMDNSSHLLLLVPLHLYLASYIDDLLPCFTLWAIVLFPSTQLANNLAGSGRGRPWLSERSVGSDSGRGSESRGSRARPPRLQVKTPGVRPARSLRHSRREREAAGIPDGQCPESPGFQVTYGESWPG